MPEASAQNTNGTTAMPTTDTVSNRQTGPARSSTSRPTVNVAQRLLHQRLGTGAHGPIEDEIQCQGDEKKKRDDAPYPAQARHDGPPQSSPLVTQGTNASSLPPNAPGPMTTCPPPGMNSAGASNAPPTMTRSPSNLGASDTWRCRRPRRRCRRWTAVLQCWLRQHHDHVAVDVAVDGGAPKMTTASRTPSPAASV